MAATVMAGGHSASAAYPPEPGDTVPNREMPVLPDSGTPTDSDTPATTGSSTPAGTNGTLPQTGGPGTMQILLVGGAALGAGVVISGAVAGSRRRDASSAAA